MKYWQYKRKIEYLQGLINSNNKEIEFMQIENKKILNQMIDLKTSHNKKNPLK